MGPGGYYVYEWVMDGNFVAGVYVGYQVLRAWWREL